MNKNRILTLLCTSTLIISFVIGICNNTSTAAEEGAYVIVTEQEVEDGIYLLEFKVAAVSDLYGLSIDMVYDDSKLEVVDHLGNSITHDDPVTTPEDFFGSNMTEVNRSVMVDIYGGANTADSFIGINELDGNQLSFAKYLSGNRTGIEIDDVSTFGFIYFKVKDNQTFNGFGELNITSDVDAINYSTICIKLADSQGESIIPNVIPTISSIDVTVSDDTDGCYFDSDAVNFTFTNQDLQILGASNVKAVLLKEDQSTEVMSGLNITSDGSANFTVDGTLPASVGEGEIALEATYPTGISDVITLTWDSETKSLEVLEDYAGVDMTMSPQLSAIDNLYNTAVPIQFTFGTKGSIEVEAGIDIFNNIDTLALMSSNIQLGELNTDVYGIDVDMSVLAFLSGFSGSVVVNDVDLPVIIGVAESGYTISNVTFDTGTKVASFDVSDFASRYELILGETTINLDITDVEALAGTEIVQVVIEGSESVIENFTEDVSFNAGVGFVSVIMPAVCVAGDTITIIIEGYKADEYIFEADFEPETPVNVSLDIRPGNLNTDNKVDINDFIEFASDYNKTITTNALSDVNGDGIVDVKDLYYIAKYMEVE